jgi:hypothetical protein
MASLTCWLKFGLPLAVLCAFAVLLPYVRVQADDSDHTECGPGRKGAIECHCPRMVLDRRAADEMACLADAHGDRKRYETCLEQIPQTCDMLEHPRRDPETQAPEPNSCAKWCKLNLCFCNDERCGPHGEVPPKEAPKRRRRR